MTIETAQNDELAALNYFMPADSLVERIETLRVMFAGAHPNSNQCGSRVSDDGATWWLQSPEGTLTVTLLGRGVVMEVFFGLEFEDINTEHETTADVTLLSSLGEHGWEYHSASVAESFIGAFEDITDVLYMPSDVLCDYVKRR